MAKNSQNYGLTASYSGVEIHDGQWIDANEHGVYFKHRKSGSSIMITRFIPADKVIACIGKIGGEGQLYVKSDNIPVFRSGKKGKAKPQEVTGMTPMGPLLSTQSEQFKNIVVHRDLAQFMGEERDENAPKRGRKAAADKGEKKKKPVKAATKAPKGKTVKGEDWE